MLYITWPILAYLLGSIPFGLIIGKSLCEIDPRTAGSCNIGATNVARLCGTRYGVATLVCDLLKGLLPVLMAGMLDDSRFFISIVGLCAILGHVYPCFLGFKGGKAVATAMGSFLGVAFFPAFFAMACCFAVIMFSGFVSMGSLTFGLALPVFILLSGHFSALPVALVVMGLLFWRHKENIARLSQGTEKPWRKKKAE